MIWNQHIGINLKSQFTYVAKTLLTILYKDVINTGNICNYRFQPAQISVSANNLPFLT
jgi:hypothetical protein